MQIAQPIFKIYGHNKIFSGKIRTVKVFEDNSLVKELVNEIVEGDVMVVDGGGSLNCSLPVSYTHLTLTTNREE